MRFQLPKELDEKLERYAPWLEFSAKEKRMVLKEDTPQELVDDYEATFRQIHEYKALIRE